jgi:hypothetical protein
MQGRLPPQLLSCALELVLCIVPLLCYLPCCDSSNDKHIIEIGNWKLSMNSRSETCTIYVYSRSTIDIQIPAVHH